VLVGTGASQQMFSIHEQVVTKRSEFFRAGRQKRWNQKNEAKMMLLGEDPYVFSAYLHTVYFGRDHLKKLSGSDEDSNEDRSNEDDNTNTRDDSKDDKTAMFLTDLYLLADKLLDPVTANLVIDELAEFHDSLNHIGHTAVIHAYASTKDGSPLRKLLRDIYVHDVDPFWASKAQELGLPYVLLQDIINEISHLRWDDPKRTMDEVFSYNTT
jgi:hypothetical protein